MSRTNFVLSGVEHEKRFLTLVPDLFAVKVHDSDYQRNGPKLELFFYEKTDVSPLLMSKA